MLRRIGFEYAEQIDPFDGGPHFVANTDDITIVRDAAEVEVRTVDDAAAAARGRSSRVETPGREAAVPRDRCARDAARRRRASGITEDARRGSGSRTARRYGSATADAAGSRAQCSALAACSALGRGARLGRPSRPASAAVRAPRAGARMPPLAGARCAAATARSSRSRRRRRVGRAGDGLLCRDVTSRRGARPRRSRRGAQRIEPAVKADRARCRRAGGGAGPACSRSRSSSAPLSRPAARASDRRAA